MTATVNEGNAMSAPSGFHEGELAVQQRAGVRVEAARLSHMLDPASLSGGAASFLRQREFAVLTARDRRGELWMSPLVGPAGFLRGDGTDLAIRSVPTEPDPLADLLPGQEVGLIAIDFATRRRMRINGRLTESGPQSLRIEVEQAYGNCPQYIHRRQLKPSGSTNQPGRVRGATRRATTLDDAQRSLVEQADTFFLGTTHPTRGADASHRGGRPGFVRTDGTTLTWPDYPGNNMFNSLGNLAADDSAALLFIDFATGATLHLSGSAYVDWTVPESGDDFDTGRLVRFTIRSVASVPPAAAEDRTPETP